MYYVTLPRRSGVLKGNPSAEEVLSGIQAFILYSEGDILYFRLNAVQKCA